MIQYTKYGKHRYKVYFYDENLNCVNIITENVNLKNINDMILSYHKTPYSILQYKHMINKYGILGFSKTGYYISNIQVQNNYQMVFVDMMQLDKVKKNKMFNREFTIKEILNGK